MREEAASNDNVEDVQTKDSIPPDKEALRPRRVQVFFKGLSMRDFLCPVCSGVEWSNLRRYQSSIRVVPQGLTRPRNMSVSIARCNSCRLEFNLDLLTGVDFSELYVEDQLYSHTDYVYQNELYPKYSVDTIDEILNFVTQPGRLMEIGFLNTDLLARFSKLGWDTLGVDLDPQAVEKARAQGFDAYATDISGPVLDGEKFDLIFAIAVLEHIEDPRKFVSRISELLRPGGVALFQLPNPVSLNKWVSSHSPHGWDMYLEPGHVYHYKQRHLETLFENAGLAMVKFFTSTIRIRGKIPFLPFRWLLLERLVNHLNHKVPAFCTFYTAGLRLLDYFKLGDTQTILVKKN